MYEPDKKFVSKPEHDENLPRPRHFKSHLPAPLLPVDIWKKKPKVLLYNEIYNRKLKKKSFFKMIHICRNPKDVAVSIYHYLINFFGYVQPIEDHFEGFLDDQWVYHPFIDHHLLYWNLEKEGYPNILYLTYEEMIQDLDGVIGKVQNFLGKSYAKEQIEQLKNHLSFANMKVNDAVNRSNELLGAPLDRTIFMRKGKIGSYKDEMPEEYIKKFDEWLSKSLENKEHRFHLQ